MIVQKKNTNNEKHIISEVTVVVVFLVKREDYSNHVWDICVGVWTLGPIYLLRVVVFIATSVLILQKL